MPETPDFLTLRRNRDDAGAREVPIRRIVIGLITLVCLAGLLNAFGQRPETSRAAVSAASLKVYAPSRIRGGLFYEARFTIEARRDLKNATLVLDPGWAEGITINTVEPAPIGEASRNGDLVFELGHVPAGQKHLFFLQLQVNPTNLGRRSQDVALYDADTFLVSIERTITVFP
ncbi:hypothetical protein BH18ACT12_BH18ACT12_22000 [soil metagenome]